MPLPPAHSTPRPIGYDPAEQLEDEENGEQPSAAPISRLPARPEDPAEQLSPAAARPTSRAAEPDPAPVTDPAGGVPSDEAEFSAPVKIDAPSSAGSSPASADRPSTPGSLRPQFKLGSAEWAALGGFLLFGIVVCALFFKFLYKEDRTPKGEKPALSFSTPMKGQIATIIKAESNWRSRHATDKGRADFTELPEVRLTLDPSQSKDGYLRLEIADSRGDLQGDVIMLRVEGGKFKDTNRGEALSDGGTTASIASTEGFFSESALRWYLGNSEPRWTIRIQEGADYSKGPWKTLGYAKITNDKR